MNPDRPLVCILLTACLAACSSPAPQPTPRRVGADRDVHGCIASAGYAWCARESQCVRPWELARARGLQPGSDVLRGYCNAAVTP